MPTTRKTKGRATLMPLTQPNEALIEAFRECHADGHQWKHLKGSVDPVDAEAGMRPPWNAFNSWAGARRAIAVAASASAGTRGAARSPTATGCVTATTTSVRHLMTSRRAAPTTAATW
jgi:hypothetical protein